jgi:arylsulfatase A-like enzyme
MSGRRTATAIAAVLVVAVLLAGFAGCSGDAPERPNVALVVLDTVRADRITCSGGERVATPHIGALCDRGIFFANASSTSSWTLPAHASLFTGLYPLQHGATQEHTRLDEGASTLAEILGAHGYRTFGASANPLVSVKSGLARGFDSFAETWRVGRETPYPAAREHPNFRAVERLLAELAPGERFFLFVNYVEAHGPYDPPEPHRSRALSPGAAPALVDRAGRLGAAKYYLDPWSISPAEFAVINELYDGEVAYLDELLGGLLDGLEEGGYLDDTLVIITSDHGENLGDHGHFRHVFSLYGSTIRVPLLLLPGGDRAGEVRTESVGLVDVFATILAAAGVTAPEGAVQGRDLLGDLKADEAAPIIAEYYFPLQALELFQPEAALTRREVLEPHLRRLRSIEMDGLRLIWSSDGRHELFDLAEDPDEQRNLRGEPQVAETEQRLRARLDAFVESGGGPRPLPDEAQRLSKPVGAFEDLDPVSAEMLRELGYLPR